MKAFSEALLESESGCAAQLARFFPRAVSVRVPVQVSVRRTSGAALREATVLELADAEHAIFVSSLPLEFNDHVRVERTSHESAEATVVAVQYREARKAVAVKFAEPAGDWVKRA